MSFWNRLAVHGAHPAVLEEGGPGLNYRELDAEVERVARSLERWPGKVLGFLRLRNTTGSLIGYLAGLRAGHALMLLDEELQPERAAHLQALYGPSWVWQPLSRGPDALISSHGHGLFPLSSREEVVIHPSLALLLTTSGSTGSPKAVRLAGTALQANAEAIVAYLQLHPGERPVTTLPMHYSYGLSVVNSHLAAGATLLMTGRSLVSREFWAFCRQERATSLAGVPYTYGMLERLRFSGMALPHLKTLTQAGGRLEADAVRRFGEQARQHGRRFFVMYGQTEATARIAYLHPDKVLSKPGSIGQAIPGGNLSLERDGRPVEPGEEGELIYRGPNVMLGLAESRADLARGDELGGRLATGDLGRVDEEGDYFITGRTKRFIKLHGQRLNLDEVEKELLDGGWDCACGGRDNLLAVALLPGQAVDRLPAELSRRFGLHHSVIRCIEVAVFPRSAAGKLLYDNLFAGQLS
ncbi:MAG: AMP-binding protein [Magnetococcales bacterium]|nr:AMP-binding protein [Magnetococcales bacterium]